MKIKLTVIFILITLGAFSQSVKREIPPPVYDPNPKYHIKGYTYVDRIMDNGDTTFVIKLYPIMVFARKVDMRRYERLIRNIKIVYPIARYAHYKLYEMEQTLKTMTSKYEQDKYVKKVEKELKDAYTPILKQMSFSQGKLLIKLIDRQTGRTSYDIVKEMRGGLRAFFWQGIARIFGANLKDEYDREGGDKTVEMLIKMYESGQL